MTAAIRPTPCEACPYRRDVPSGLWEAHEYEKLRAYDAPTWGQPAAPFACHAAPGSLCHGWAVVHESRGHEFALLALRLRTAVVPPAVVPLFGSGAEAADHGERDVEDPGPEARRAMVRLMGRHPRLRE